MRIPHTIDNNTLLVYDASEEARQSTSEKGRLLRAEDATWDEGHVPLLSQICVKYLPATLVAFLPCNVKHYMLETLSTDLPLKLAAKEIEDGIYWKRRTEDRWRTPTNIQDVDGSWKRMYMEKYTQEYLEGLVPEDFELGEIEELCKLVRKFVYCLNLRELQTQRRFLEDDDDGMDEEPSDRINLKPIIIGLKNLRELHIQFGVRNVGSNYRNVLLQFTAQDCRNIGLGVAEAQNLKLLRIHHSDLDDNKLITLLTQMQRNSSLEVLDFSHCSLSDEGAAAIAKFLSERSTLRKLIISNNKIGETGVKALAFVLTQKNGCGLFELNLRLNWFGDAGAQYLLSALLRKAPALRVLNLSCSGLKEDSGLLLGEMLSRNESLRDLDISNNALGEQAGSAIVRGMQLNKTLLFLDLRMTGILKEEQLELEKILHGNRCKSRLEGSADDSFL